MWPVRFGFMPTSSRFDLFSGRLLRDLLWTTKIPESSMLNALCPPTVTLKDGSAVIGIRITLGALPDTRLIKAN
jgi:hypothetical protein